MHRTERYTQRMVQTMLINYLSVTGRWQDKNLDPIYETPTSISTLFSLDDLLIARFSQWRKLLHWFTFWRMLLIELQISNKQFRDQHCEKHRCTAQCKLLIFIMCIFPVLFRYLKLPAHKKWQIKLLEVFLFWTARKISTRLKVKGN